MTFETFDITKMTSLEQLLDIKNPGSNGATGHYDENGVWRYDKKPSKTGDPQKNDLEYKKKIQQLKQSYINYFSKKGNIKILYKIKDKQFTFPNYKTAVANKLVTNKNEYVRLFKEQYIHFALTKQQK